MADHRFGLLAASSNSAAAARRRRSFLAVSTKALKRACIAYYADADMQQFVDSWMTLIGQSERRDVDCLNRLKVALASRRTSFEALKRAVADVRQAGLVEAEGLADVGEKRLLVGSLEDIAAERDCVLAKTEFVSAKGMESWLVLSDGLMDHH